MREIKFRAWTIKRKEWHYFTLTTIMHWPNDADSYLNYEKWCQYTGLKDKDGKEIYEGDIINVQDGGEYFDYKRGQNLVIKWWDDILGYGLFWPRTKDAYEIDVNPFSLEPEIEIIGNIYENSELLK